MDGLWVVNASTGGHGVDDIPSEREDQDKPTRCSVTQWSLNQGPMIRSWQASAAFDSGFHDLCSGRKVAMTQIGPGFQTARSGKYLTHLFALGTSQEKAARSWVLQPEADSVLDGCNMVKFPGSLWEGAVVRIHTEGTKHKHSAGEPPLFAPSYCAEQRATR
ncbi:hypothetical protein VTI74DRAFT_8167 [Chaetomium olivicolor]